MQSESRSAASAWLTHLLGSASEHAVIFVNAEGVVVAWLGAAERMFGYRKAEALELEFGDLFTADDRRLQLDLQELAVARAVGRSEDERWHVRKDGSLFWASGVVAAVRTPQGSIEAYCKILRDRTDLRQQLDALQNRVRALQQENDRKSRLLESLGYQLQSLAGPLAKVADLADSEQPQVLRGRQVAARARQLAAMAQVLEREAAQEQSSRLGMPEPLLKARPLNLQDALKAVIKGLRLAAGRQIHLTAPPIALTVFSEPGRLREMLQSLLAHALKQAASGGDIHVTASREGASAVIRVIDDGTGISGKRLSRLLLLLTGAEPSAKVQESEVELAAARQLALLHGGSLEAKSPGHSKGSVLCLRLPMAP
jgi:PAS domain S-box-containing protein